MWPLPGTDDSHEGEKQGEQQQPGNIQDTRPDSCGAHRRVQFTAKPLHSIAHLSICMSQFCCQILKVSTGLRVR